MLGPTAPLFVAALAAFAVPGPERPGAAPRPAAGFQDAVAQDAAATLTAASGRLAAGDLAGAEALLAPLQDAEPAVPRAVFLYGYCLHAQGRLEEALAARERAAGFASTKPGATYNAACALALLGRADESLARLREAVALGATWRSQLLTDADPASLRADPRFAALLPAARQGADAFVEPVRVLASLDGEGPGHQFGWVARAVGDLDGDGVPDLAVGAWQNSDGGPSAGRVVLVSGADGARLGAWTCREPGDTLGFDSQGLGDVDGDGVPDVVVTAAWSAVNGVRSGRVFVLAGPPRPGPAGGAGAGDDEAP